MYIIITKNWDTGRFMAPWPAGGGYFGMFVPYGQIDPRCVCYLWILNLIERLLIYDVHDDISVRLPKFSSGICLGTWCNENPEKMPALHIVTLFA